MNALSAHTSLLTLMLSASHLMIYGLIILLFSALSIYAYKINRKLKKQKELNHHQQQLILCKEAMLEGEERERRKIARDLHDGLGGMLAGIKLKLSGFLVHQKHTESLGDALHKIIEQLDSSLTEVRGIARNMVPENLICFGLQTALEDLCLSFTTKNQVISFQAFCICNQMNLSTQLVIYRIVQEALANAIRHSGAKKIIVQCSQNDDRFFITIEDNGVGFDLMANSSNGIGLNNIKSRVKYLNGKIEVISVQNEGTTINLELNVAA